MSSTYGHVYPGALHLHSLHSDGTGTIAEIAQAARRAGLRWIIMTDHNTLAGRPEQGWHDDLLVLVEQEITPDRNHFLAFDLDVAINAEQPTQQYLDEVYARGGWGVIAHPDERTDNDLKHPFNWEDWTIDGPTQHTDAPIGIELWNWMSDWAEALTPRTKHLNFFFPHRVIRGPTAATLAWWDRLNAAGRPTFGVGNLDSHALDVHALGRTWKLFPYEMLFRTVTNYLWLPAPLSNDAGTARRQVLDAIGAGRLWFANRRYGAAASITFHVEQSGRAICIGERARLADGPATIRADVGAGSDLRLIHNGTPVARNRDRLVYPVQQPGVYRIEAQRQHQPWLFSNPIVIE
jgi:hypothetical protein